MATTPPASLSDHDLLVETERAAATERHATAALLALLAEVDARRLYLVEGFSSIFAYATRRLHLSEPAAYLRITAARKAHRFPVVLTLLDTGALSLSTVGLLAPHLTDENHVALLDAARHKSKREVERLVAAVDPQPDIPSSVRALAVRRPPVSADQAAPSQASTLEPTTPSLFGPTNADPGAALPPPVSAPGAVTRSTAPRRPALVAPLAPRRYLIRLTVSDETQQKLVRARDLLRPVIPDGDLAAIVDRALTVLLAQTARGKLGAVARPRAQPISRVHPVGVASSRHVPASVRRTVWAHGRPARRLDWRRELCPDRAELLAA